MQLDLFSRVPSENFQVTDVKQCVGKSNSVPGFCVDLVSSENGKPLLRNMWLAITSGSLN